MRPNPHHLARQIITRLIETKHALLLEIQRIPKFKRIDESWVLSLAVALQDANVDALPQGNRELRSFILNDSSYAKREARTGLDELLNNDSHIRTCCQTAWGLARAIDLLTPEALEVMTIGWNEGGVEAAVSRMLELIYESEFRRNIFLRVYNLDCQSLPAELPVIVKLEHSDIAKLLGEYTDRSALHDQNTGNCFFKFTDNEALGDNEAFQKAWSKGHELLAVLKYLKYGVIDIDYGAVYYSPDWVSYIRRHGIGFWGQPRRDRQSQFYTLTEREVPTLIQYFVAYTKLKPVIDDPQPNSLRMANALAANYYEWHYRRTENEQDQKLIELVTALEALFSPGKEGELRFRIAQRAAILLGKDASDREKLARFFKKLYDGRSQILHSGMTAFNPSQALKDKHKDLTILNESQLIQLADLVRQAILRTLTLVWRGKTERDEVNSLLDKAALNESVRNEVFQLSDFEQAIKEVSTA